MATSVRLDPDVERRLGQLAQKTGRTKSYYIRQAVQTMIGQMEYEQGILTASAERRAGTRRTYGAAEARKALLGHVAD